VAGRLCSLCSVLIHGERAYRDVEVEPFVIARIGRIRDPVVVSREHRKGLPKPVFVAALRALKEAGCRSYGNQYYIKVTVTNEHWFATAKRLRVL